MPGGPFSAFQDDYKKFWKPENLANSDQSIRILNPGCYSKDFDPRQCANGQCWSIRTLTEDNEICSSVYNKRSNSKSENNFVQYNFELQLLWSRRILVIILYFDVQRRLIYHIICVFFVIQM